MPKVIEVDNLFGVTLRQTLWQFLTVEKIADYFEEYWETYLASNKIEDAISVSKFSRQVSSPE
ncbi:MAG: hypothetical protein GY927_22590 [bacterium]|nr:hypothetical protein [bacterium]